jgi:hypothetical protein
MAPINFKRCFDLINGFTSSDIVQTDIEIKSCLHVTQSNYSPLHSVKAGYRLRTNLLRLISLEIAFIFT